MQKMLYWDKKHDALMIDSRSNYLGEEKRKRATLYTSFFTEVVQLKSIQLYPLLLIKQLKNKNDSPPLF